MLRKERATENMRRNQSMGVEMILRMSFKQNLREFVDNCSLAGVKQVFEPNIGICKRILWIMVFLTAVGTCYYYLLCIWSDTLAKPLIVTMETSTDPISNVDFPAIAICSFNRISKKVIQAMAKKYHKDLAKNGESVEDVESYLLEWGRLIDLSYNESTRNHPIFNAMIDMYHDRTGSDFVVDLMKKLAPNCNDLLVRCGWDGAIVDCDRLFNTRRTTQGHCCTFNYVLDYTTDGRPTIVLNEIKKQSDAGYINGLNVILDPQVDDYAYPLGPMEGFEIQIYPPATYPDPRAGRVIQRVINPKRTVFFELGSIRQIATSEVRKYSPTTRQCHFKDENKEKYNGMYSYSGCIVNCRVSTIFSLCKCTPFFITHYRISADAKTCNIEDLKCLNKYREKLYYLYPQTPDKAGLEMEVQESLFCPECLPDCEHTRFYIQSYDIPLRSTKLKHKEFKNGFLNGINMTGRSFMSVYFPVPDSTLNRLDVVNYWYEILSTIGGFGGIVMGFSIILVIEILYYCCFRFFIIFRINYQKYHN